MNKYKKNIILVNGFLKFIELNRRYSDHTIRAYKKDLFDFIDYLGEDILAVDAKKYDIHEFVIQISKIKKQAYKDTLCITLMSRRKLLMRLFWNSK